MKTKLKFYRVQDVIMGGKQNGWIENKPPSNGVSSGLGKKQK